jgi:hypothetical protein
MARAKVSQMSAREKRARAKTQKAFNAKPKNAKKRQEANKGRKKLGIPKGSKMDASHQKGGGMKKESRSSNRARGGRIGNRAGKAQGGRNSSRKGVKNRR